MLINWTLVEQRRAERGLSRAELARKAYLHPADLLSYDEPGADDSGLTIGTINALAAALGLPPQLCCDPNRLPASPPHLPVSSGWRDPTQTSTPRGSTGTPS